MAVAVVGAGEDDDADGGIVARDGERIVHLVDRQRRERVAALGTVDGDLGDAIAGLVDDLTILLAGLPNDIAHKLPFD